MAIAFETLTATELSYAFAEGEADPMDATDFFLERAKQTEGVFVTLTEQRARCEARSSRERWKSRAPLSPLDGVPVAWKDLFDIRGIVTTTRSFALRDSCVPSRDAAVVARASRAGMVCLGKTTLPRFAYSQPGIDGSVALAKSRLNGQSRAPETSSASAVAVALGAVPVAMGTDISGSMGIPTEFDGLVGFKSSTTRYNQRGVFPLSPTLDSVGPLVRSVQDCITLDSVLRARIHPAPAKSASIEGQHFLIESTVYQQEAMDSAARHNLEQTVRRLEEMGGVVEQREVRAIRETLALIARFGWLGWAEMLALHEDLVLGGKAGCFDFGIRRCIEGVRGMRATDFAKLLCGREALMSRIRRELRGAILVFPTTGGLNPLRVSTDARGGAGFVRDCRMLCSTVVASFLDMPAVTLPAGTDEAGVPTTLLLSAPRGEDDRLLGVALGLENGQEICRTGNAVASIPCPTRAPSAVFRRARESSSES